MKRVALLLTVALAMTLACAGLALAQDAPTPSQGQGPPEGVIPGQYIVVFKDEGSGSHRGSPSARPTLRRRDTLHLPALHKRLRCSPPRGTTRQGTR